VIPIILGKQQPGPSSSGFVGQNWVLGPMPGVLKPTRHATARAEREPGRVSRVFFMPRAKITTPATSFPISKPSDET
jgi:hypothetical protein